MRDFTGATAFVTGAASGIGRALGLALGKTEVRRVMICDVDREGLEQTREDIREAGGRSEAHLLDAGNRDAVHEIAQRIQREHGGADIVINCAGIAQSATVADLTYDDLDRVMRVNFWGMVYGTKAFLPQLIEKGRGNLVNISSVFGLYGVPGQSAYNASKFAIRGFTEALWHEMRKSEIVVSSVHPGGIKTNIAKKMILPQAQDTPEERERIAALFDEFAANTPDYAAQTIIRGMRRGKARILIGRDARYMDRIVRLFPQSYHRIFFRKEQDGVGIFAGEETANEEGDKK